MSYSLLASSGDGRYTPFANAAGTSSAALHSLAVWTDNWVSCVVIYLFLALIIDVGGAIVLAQGVDPIVSFNNPIFGSTSPTDM